MAATILVTGFGPFPGAPFNPTGPLVKALARMRRPCLADAKIVAHVFPTSYAAVDRDLPRLIARHKPDALLMFGLAPRASTVRIETRARNTVSLLPDAGGAALHRHAIAFGGPGTIALPAPAQDLLAAVARLACAGRAVARCRTLSVQLPMLARRRGDPKGRPARRGFRPRSPGPARAGRAPARQKSPFDACRSGAGGQRLAVGDRRRSTALTSRGEDAPHAD